MGITERIQEIEDEMKKTQKNKKTEYHLGRLKAQLAKLRRELIEPSKSYSKGEGFAVQKFGNARVALVGFPSVGKSSLLSVLTPTDSKVSDLDFTTLTCVPGILNYRDAKIQLLDLPGIIEGAASGKGNGRQVLAVAKASDLLLIVLDPLYGIEQKKKILKELFEMGIRINKSRPNIVINKTNIGGVKVSSTINLTHLDDQLVKVILQEYKILNAEVIIREDCTVDDLIDTIEGNRKYVDTIFVYNKIDTISIEDIDELANRENSVVISVSFKLNLDYLLEVIWDKLDLVRVYTKKRGNYPDFNDPMILTKNRKGCTIESLCKSIHNEFKNEFKYALIWGQSAKFSPQTCGLSHQLMDEDVIQIFISQKKTKETLLNNKLEKDKEKKLKQIEREKKKYKKK